MHKEQIKFWLNVALQIPPLEYNDHNLRPLIFRDLILMSESPQRCMVLSLHQRVHGPPNLRSQGCCVCLYVCPLFIPVTSVSFPGQSLSKCKSLYPHYILGCAYPVKTESPSLQRWRPRPCAYQTLTPLRGVSRQPAKPWPLTQGGAR